MTMSNQEAYRIITNCAKQIHCIECAHKSECKYEEAETTVREALQKLESLSECYEHSKTDENTQFVEGVVYALDITKGILNRIIENQGGK